MSMPPLDDGISPGIVNAVRWLRSCGFRTSDSGDGSRAAAGEECAFPHPMVAMVVDPPLLLSEADRLLGIIRHKGASGLVIEASYDPLDQRGLILIHDPEMTGLFSRLAPSKGAER